MALIKPVITPFNNDIPSGDQTMSVVTWSGITTGAICAPVSLAHWSDRSVQIDGVFGSGGTVTVNGSNNNVTYYGLNDPSLTPISKTSGGISQILEITAYVYPVITSGDSNTLLTVTMLCRRPQNLLQPQ